MGSNPWVAPLWSDLGCWSRTVVVIKLLQTSALTTGYSMVRQHRHLPLQLNVSAGHCHNLFVLFQASHWDLDSFWTWKILESVDFSILIDEASKNFKNWNKTPIVIIIDWHLLGFFARNLLSNRNSLITVPVSCGVLTVAACAWLAKYFELDAWAGWTHPDKLRASDWFKAVARDLTKGLVLLCQ